MNQLWPRLASSAARQIFDDLEENSATSPVGATSHPLQTFAATGGSRVTPKMVGDLTDVLAEIASRYGFPNNSPVADRIAFDREAAEEISGMMAITAFEASQPGVWTFLALVAMPDITLWRFGFNNRERWVASDLTRHMFSRLWWQAFTFGQPCDGRVDFQLLHSLSESDLNQLTERRSIGGNHRLARAVARELDAHPKRGRATVRHVARKLRRLSAFIDFAGLSEGDLDALVGVTVLEALQSQAVD